MKYRIKEIDGEYFIQIKRSLSLFWKKIFTCDSGGTFYYSNEIHPVKFSNFMEASKLLSELISNPNSRYKYYHKIFFNADLLSIAVFNKN